MQIRIFTCAHTCRCVLSLAQARAGRHGNGLWKQPGQAEALKQVLFRLQAVEAELQQRPRQRQPEASGPPAAEIPEQQVESRAGGAAGPPGPG